MASLPNLSFHRSVGPRGMRRVGLGLLALALIALVVAAALAVRAQQRSDWPTTEGTIVEITPYERQTRGRAPISNREPLWTYSVRYSVAGQSYTWTSPGGDNIKREIGQTRVIHYNPDDPSQASVAGWGLWLGPTIAGGLTLFLLLLGSLLWWVGRQTRARM